MAGIPVVIVDKGGIPVTEAANGRGTSVEVASNGRGTAVTYCDRGIPVVTAGSMPDWVPEGASFFADFDNNRYWKGTVGTAATLITPFQIALGQYVFPMSAVGVTGDPYTLLMDLEYAASPSNNQYLASVGNADASNRLDMTVALTTKIAGHLFVGGADQGGVSSLMDIATHTRFVVGMASDASGASVKFGSDGAQSIINTIPAGFTKMSFGISTQSTLPSNATVHTITVFNEKRAL